ncbi:hypothetical protein TrRE_jg2172 [Triparma retinervis]|uniref:Uncharacterized protein n=1 Tax=Triparma retinervis TaxID=2557542 RepID=A0A9W7E6A2_9STRA|nr:hypothetical protein TrRE_jg2172 [Triparma retinervis]
MKQASEKRKKDQLDDGIKAAEEILKLKAALDAAEKEVLAGRKTIAVRDAKIVENEKIIAGVTEENMQLRLQVQRME